MIGVDPGGIRIETPDLPRRADRLIRRNRPLSREQRLMVRDTAIAIMHNRHNWDIPKLCVAFGLSRFQIHRILKSVEEGMQMKGVRA